MPAARFSCFGVPVNLAAPSLASLARLMARLPPGAQRADETAARAGEIRYALERRDGELAAITNRKRVIAAGEREKPLLDRLESHLALRVATQSRELLFIHAGVVGWRGRALIFPGRTMAGKSTLTAALVRAGATYFSDEYALLDGDGRVHPYARPIALRTARGPRRMRVARAAVKPLPVAMVILCRHRTNARLRLEPLSPGRAVLAILEHTVAARAQAATAMERLSRLATSARTFEGVRGDARRAAELILRGTLVEHS